MIVLFKLNPKILEKAGYRKVPSHVNSKREVDENWITQSKFGKNNFPRFHLEKIDKKWHLHYDYFKNGYDTHSSNTKSQIVRNERDRLKKLSINYANRGL